MQTAKHRLMPTLSRWLLGPGTTFRNGSRTWLYLSYLGLILAFLAAAALRH